MALASNGVGSGIDINALVTQLMTLERRPLTGLARQEGVLQAKLSAIGQLRGGLSALNAAAEGLAGAAGTAVWNATVRNPEAIRATATPAASAGTYSLNVMQLAASQKIAAAGQTAASTTIGTGISTSITIDFGTISGGTLDPEDGRYSGAGFIPGSATSTNINLPAGNMTLESIRDAINGAGAGATASIVNDGSAAPYRLVLSGAATGLDRSMRITVNGDPALSDLLTYDPAGTQNLMQLQPARNARLSIDGLLIENGSNTLSDAVPGVTITLAQEISSTVIDVAQDTSALGRAVEALARSWNALNKILSETTSEKEILQGEPAALSVQTQVRRLLGAAYTSGPIRTLSQIGTTFQRDGSLQYEGARLTEAIATAGYPHIASLTADVADSLKTATAALLADNGGLGSRSSGLNRSLETIGDRRERLNARLELIETRYRTQFNALDRMLASMNQTSSYLAQQLQALNATTGGGA